MVNRRGEKAFGIFAFRIARVVVTAVGIAGLFGCADEAATSPVSNDPFVYLILVPEPIPTQAPPPADSSILALLVTAGSPARSPFRRAERFEIRRVSDGSVFRFTNRNLELTLPPVDHRGVSIESANYVLKHANSLGGGLGSSALLPLDSYDLLIETEGRVINGRVTIPQRPSPRLVMSGTKRFVVFSPAAGAAAYFVSADTELAPDRFVKDTIVELLYDRDARFITAPPEFRVTALDANLFLYLSDANTSKAGVDGGLGLFGAASSAKIRLPER